MTEAVPLGELLHEEALFGLPASERWDYPRGRLFPSGLCLSVISRVVWAWPDPLPTRLKRVGKNVHTLWWAELDRLHSMTHANPPLGLGVESGVSRPFTELESFNAAFFTIKAAGSLAEAKFTTGVRKRHQTSFYSFSRDD